VEVGLYFIDERIDQQYRLLFALLSMNGIKQGVAGLEQLLMLFIDPAVATIERRGPNELRSAGLFSLQANQGITSGRSGGSALPQNSGAY
jgi:hypothetical protein